MASCGSLQQIFENPLPENPTLIQSLSPWNQMKSIKKPIEVSSFTEIFGELHFKENPHELLSSSASSSSSLSSSASSSSSSIDRNSQNEIENNKKYPSSISCLDTPKYQFKGCSKNSDGGGYSSKNLESLQLCTEGLGVESFDSVEESMNEKGDNNWENNHKKEKVKNPPSNNLCHELRRSRTGEKSFPPPISCIASTGKPWVCFKSYRQDGRFVLKEIRIPTQEFLRAFREDGRLKLHFVHQDQEINDEEEETGTEEEEEDNDDDDDSNEEKNEE